MDDSFPWHFAVMIFIAFAIWVRNRIQAVAEFRRQRREQRARARRSYQGVTRAAPSAAEQLRPASPGTPAPPESLSEVFEQIREAWQQENAPPTPSEPPVQRTQERIQPPPLPGARHAAEAEAAIPARSGAPAVQATYRAARFRHRSPAAAQLLSSLRDRDRVRSAFILKEILDKPVTLR